MFLIIEANKRPDVWALPGGRINNNENVQESFRREIKEELGVNNFKILGMVDFETWRAKSGFAVCAAAYLIESEDKIKLSDEHTRVK